MAVVTTIEIFEGHRASFVLFAWVPGLARRGGGICWLNGWVWALCKNAPNGPFDPFKHLQSARARKSAMYSRTLIRVAGNRDWRDRLQ